MIGESPTRPKLGIVFTHGGARGRLSNTFGFPFIARALAREGYRKRDISLPDLAATVTYGGFLKMAAHYWRMGLGEMWRSYNKAAFVKALQRMLPEGTVANVAVTGAGLTCVDLVFITPTAPESTLAEMVADSPLRFVFERGARVLIDKTPGRRALPELAPDPPLLPEQQEFTNRVACYLNELVRASNLLGHGELWRAAKAINEEIRPNLLALLEWHARARHIPGSTEWGYGRFIERWADPRALAALPATYTDSTPVETRSIVDAGGPGRHSGARTRG